MSLYKYLSIQTLKNVINGSIRFTQPGAFNDPFEMLPELHIPETYPEKINFSFDIVSPRRIPPVAELPNNFKSDYCNDYSSRLILKELNKIIGILCLSKNKNSLLMWSHYADQYAGAVIEFNEDHEFFKGRIEVEYRSERSKKDISSYLSESKPIPIPISELCVKSDDWKYESEVRIIRNLSDCTKVKDLQPYPIYVMDVPIEAIKSITLGERTSIPEQKNIWELVKGTNIILSLAAIANWDYQLRVEPIKLDRPYPECNPIISPRTAHIFKDYPGYLGEIARFQIEKHSLSGIANCTV